MKGSWHCHALLSEVKPALGRYAIRVGLSEKVRYDNYTLYNVQPATEEQLQYLNNLYKDTDVLDFWSVPSTVENHISVVSPPKSREEFEKALERHGISYDVVLEDIQKAFDDQTRRRRKRDSGMYWTNYQTIDEIYEWLHELARTHSNVVTLIQAGRSFEGRNITGVRISRKSGRKAFFIDGGQVDADWLSPTVVTYLINQLVTGDDPEARTASEDFEWHIFPIVNPDGHQFSQDSVRLWMKNRRPTSGSAIGVDLAKNWNSQWAVSGGSFNPSDSNYVGLGPFSEPETRYVSRYIDTIGTNLAGLLSFRAFGQRLLIPFAHTTDPMYNYRDMLLIPDGSTGTIADWVKHRFNPPVVATYQLRDRSQGYTLPVNQVLPSCEETYDSVMAMLREAKFINVL
ncbi:Zinc carboxypeptidase A 1 [Papilio machaon]|uniref:Zinc carboxypeptidase A 1 n=1 Tax=Papilio machaon TaxID=76193 RepID=A0A194RI16_PAPMA|nr:Zinc carboxypeptidase A 1 [Papilio machaon]